ncbi:signal peptide containing protein [Theileria equi strain WA]|uniref:Signal peptide containing protein n=1 Tax=Theileria equi strain WA TaxID=1537102 RepID=L1LC32_THEEQ|nr:signal peptide containing protein [Theileria equi strain WA]EKX72795.1 signal peptide containing protein [Theileria equi strain WA]|eukprot:XP_004832247.1 signal peptide containing protein [Theileria equi strain WA]
MKFLYVLSLALLVRLSSCTEVDTSLFDTEESLEGSVKVLKLIPKEGTSTNKLAYGSDVVWEDKKKTCLSAVLYFDGEKPTLAVLVTKENGKESTVYRYHDGKEWKDGNESTHNTKFGELNEKCKHAIPVTLDLSKPDETRIDTTTTHNNGVERKKHSPKNGNIGSIVDSNVTIWTAAGDQKCIEARSYTKEGSVFLVIDISDGNGTHTRNFKKVAGTWKDVTDEIKKGKGRADISDSSSKTSTGEKLKQP